MSVRAEMGSKKQKKAAYVVFKGRTPGVYYTWDDCRKQTDHFSGQDQRGYCTIQDAERAWKDYEEKTAPQTIRSPLTVLQPNTQGNLKRGRPNDPENPKCNSHGLDGLNGHQEPRSKKLKKAEDYLEDEIINLATEEAEGVLSFEPKPSFELTSAQQSAVKIALEGHNMFLTGAAGSGKTATLMKMISLLQEKFGENPHVNPRKVQVITPTAIAALPVCGRTMYSFAGWCVTPFISS